MTSDNLSLPDQTLSWQISGEEYNEGRYKNPHCNCWQCDSESCSICFPERRKTCNGTQIRNLSGWNMNQYCQYNIKQSSSAIAGNVYMLSHACFTTCTNVFKIYFKNREKFEILDGSNWKAPLKLMHILSITLLTKHSAASSIWPSWKRSCFAKVLAKAFLRALGWSDDWSLYWNCVKITWNKDK